VCPTCQKDDRIQKVSAVVSSGQVSSRLSGPTGALTYSDGEWGAIGAFTSLSGTTTTNLASKLFPPTLPQVQSDFSGILGVGFCVLALIVAPLVVGGNVAESMWEGVPPQGGKPPPNTAAKAAGVLSGTITFVALAVATFFAAKGLLGPHRTKMKRWEEQKSRHATAMKVWHNLYYCARDDIVFDPVGGISLKPDQFQPHFHNWITYGPANGASPQGSAVERDLCR
jgi:hypothetical protein